jgi:hypothetical protein
MTALQARLLAARSVQAAQAQEQFARRLRPSATIPAQRTPDEAPVPALAAVAATA